MGKGDFAGTIFRDVILLALAGFVSIVILVLPHLNPPAAQSTAPQGNVLVEIDWPGEIDADIDLWVRAPGDIPVGYSNKGGLYFNLLRDDLGQFADKTPYNHETSYSRGLPDGEYTVNVHAYRNVRNVWPVPVTISVTVTPDLGADSSERLETAVDLARVGQELTAFNFIVADGIVDYGSISHVNVPLRASGDK
jgi:hypothetical protein